MKIINEDLLKLKIEVIVEKDIAYQEMAVLLDKPEFLQLLPLLRKEYLIDKFIPLYKFMDYFYDEYSKKHNNNGINLGKYKKIRSFKKSFPEQYEFITNKTEIEGLGTRIELECSLLCYEFNRPYLFSDIIKQAILCNRVDDYFYWTAKPHTIDPLLESVVPEVALPQASILVTPTATYEDVKKAFRFIKKMIKEDKEFSYYRPGTQFVNNIREYRQWYWERFRGKKFGIIADEYVESKLPAQYNTTEHDVIRGVAIYEKLLKS